MSKRVWGRMNESTGWENPGLESDYKVIREEEKEMEEKWR